MSLIKSVRKKTLLEQCILIVCSCILLLLAFVPIFLMLTLSLKSNVQIYGNFWSLPSPIHWENYHIAIDMLIPNMINTTLLVPIATFFTLLLSSMSGYVFARLEFPGKNFLFMAVLSLMMIPGVLTLTPSYKLMQDLNLYNTWWALLLPWVSGGRFLNTALQDIYFQPSGSTFEAARIDGATEFKSYYMIAIPLSKPILATLTIMSMMNYYNDFIWPLMVIDSNYKQMITVAIRCSSLPQEQLILAPW